MSVRGPLPRREDHGLTHDLELQTLIDAMADGDAIIAGIARRTLLEPARDRATIDHRQRVLADCIEHPGLTRRLYAIASATLERRKKVYWGLVTRPDAVVHHSLELLALYRGAFRELRVLADDAKALDPAGLGAFVASLRETLDDGFLRDVGAHLAGLRFRAGIDVGARLGEGNAGTDFVLERPTAGRSAAALGRWTRQVLGREPRAYTYRLPAGDDACARALDALKSRGLAHTAAVLAEACDDLLWWFRQVRGELAFYVGCLNLIERLRAVGAPTCMPVCDDEAPRTLRASHLVDPTLALTIDQLGGGPDVVGNDVAADDVRLMVVTGANGGGKTTFLRSLGLAQLMMQAGMPVAARAYRSSVCAGVFTHFPRREDASMRSGKLDEELARLDRLVDELTDGSWLLLNESFSSTNELEGGEIADGAVRALTESGVRVLFVTHLSRYARDLHARRPPRTHFLRAERHQDGRRTFRMVAGPPARTGHGVELFHRVVGAAEPATSEPAG